MFVGGFRPPYWLKLLPTARPVMSPHPNLSPIWSLLSNTKLLSSVYKSPCAQSRFFPSSDFTPISTKPSCWAKVCKETRMNSTAVKTRWNFTNVVPLNSLLITSSILKSTWFSGSLPNKLLINGSIHTQKRGASCHSFHVLKALALPCKSKRATPESPTPV